MSKFHDLALEQFCASNLSVQVTIWQGHGWTCVKCGDHLHAASRYSYSSPSSILQANQSVTPAARTTSATTVCGFQRSVMVIKAILIAWYYYSVLFGNPYQLKPSTTNSCSYVWSNSFESSARYCVFTAPQTPPVSFCSPTPERSC